MLRQTSKQATFETSIAYRNQYFSCSHVRSHIRCLVGYDIDSELVQHWTVDKACTLRVRQLRTQESGVSETWKVDILQFRLVLTPNFSLVIIRPKIDLTKISVMLKCDAWIGTEIVKTGSRELGTDFNRIYPPEPQLISEKL